MSWQDVKRGGEKEMLMKEEECEGKSEKPREREGIRKRSSQQSVGLRARYVRNGVSLYGAQCACVNSLF